ncbi:hypothetical protein N9L68_08155, partial [bacterium]|nr:hypothetical protein [bacterium]
MSAGVASRVSDVAVTASNVRRLGCAVRSVTSATIQTWEAGVRSPTPVAQGRMARGTAVGLGRIPLLRNPSRRRRRLSGC